MVAVVVMSVAALIRAVYFLETADVPFLLAPVGDALGYHEWAKRIAAGDWLGTEPFYQAPLYPYFLATIYWFFGDGVWAARIVQGLAGAIACGLLAAATARLFGRGAGLAAGLMLAAYPPAIFFDGIIQKASLDGVLACALVWLCSILLLVERRRTFASLAIGIVAGLMCLTRENALVWLPLLAAWVLSSGKGRPWRGRVGEVVSFVVGTALVLLPVGIRNVYVGGEWSFSTFQAGPNFYIGNRQGADGRYLPLVPGHETPAFERADATRLAEQATGRKLSAREVSNYWMSRTWSEIREDPRFWMKLCVRKLAMVWNRYEVSDVESLSVYLAHSRLLSTPALFWHFGVLVPMAAAGIWLLRKRLTELWVFPVLALSLSFSVAAFFVLARYRFAIVPMLIPFAAYAVVRLPNLLRTMTSHRWGAAGGIALFVALVAGTNFAIHDERRLDALAWANLGAVYGQQGDLERAEQFLQRALADHPESAETHVNLGLVMMGRGRHLDAAEQFRKALALKPGLADAELLLALSLEQMGRFGEALRHFERAAALDPTNPDATRGVARMRDRLQEE